MSLNWAELENCFSLPLGNDENKYPVYNTPNISVFSGIKNNNLNIQNSKNEINRNWTQRMEEVSTLLPTINDLIPSSLSKNPTFTTYNSSSSIHSSYPIDTPVYKGCFNCDPEIDNLIPSNNKENKIVKISSPNIEKPYSNLTNSLVKVKRKSGNNFNGFLKPKSKLRGYPFKNKNKTFKKEDVQWVIILYLFIFIFTYMSFKTSN